MTEDDAKAIERECPSVAEAAATVRGAAQVVYGNNNWATTIQGSGPEYLDIRDYSVLSGQAFTQQDVDSSAKVALLGVTVSQNLFGQQDPVGQVFRIKNVPFTVEGSACAQRAVAVGAGPGRHHHHPHLDRQEAGARRQPGQRARGRRDPGAGPRVRR